MRGIWIQNILFQQQTISQVRKNHEMCGIFTKKKEICEYVKVQLYMNYLFKISLLNATHLCVNFVYIVL